MGVFQYILKWFRRHPGGRECSFSWLTVNDSMCYIFHAIFVNNQQQQLLLLPIEWENIVSYVEIWCASPIDGATVITMAASAKSNLRDIGVFLIFFVLDDTPSVNFVNSNYQEWYSSITYFSWRKLSELEIQIKEK